jgi:hypothetical protein
MSNKVQLPRETYTAIVTTTNDTQVCKAPWMNSKNGTLRLKKLIITNTHASATATVTFWDQDLDSATPGSYGSNAAGLLTLQVPGITSTTTLTPNPLVLGENECPNIQFIAGIAVDTDNNNLHITAEVEIEIL